MSAASTRAHVRHGLNARKTSPNSTLATGMPTQKIDVDERHREVRVGHLRAGEAAVEDEREQPHPDQAREPFERRGQPEQPPPGCSCSCGRRPQRRQRDERDDQHDRRRPAEQPHGDRQVGLAHDPVRLRRSPGARAPRGRGHRASDGSGRRTRDLMPGRSLWKRPSSARAVGSESAEPRFPRAALRP